MPGRLFGRLGAAFAGALFPLRCLVCGGFYRPPRRSKGRPAGTVTAGQPAAVFAELMGGCLCPACRKGFTPIESPLCPCCGRMFGSRVGEDHVCGECLDSLRHFGRARSAGIYERALLDVIHSFKYGGKIQLAVPLGGLLLAVLRANWRDERFDIVAPVPLHRKKLAKRGFNQSGLLLRQWERLHPDIAPGGLYCRIEKNLLVREKQTLPQTGLGRRERKANVKGAFRLNRNAKVVAKRILLVDDVYTTGATAGECARILMEEGARRVDVLTLARAV